MATKRKKKRAKSDDAQIPTQVCSACGGNHWQPDCPKIAAMVHNKEFLARNAIDKALQYAREKGFSPQLEVSFPATKRQPITLHSIYLRPLDGSDKFICACCACPYEARDDSFRGTVLTPIGWCSRCREELREAPFGVVIERYKKKRRGKMKLIKASVAKIHRLIKVQNNNGRS